MLHISCNIGTRNLPDMYALSPAALGLWAYISGKSLVPMLQLLHIPLCVGRSKASAGQYILYFPATRAIYILPGKVVPLIHTLIIRMLHKKLAIIYIVELVTFTCGMEFCILTIIKNAIIFIVVDT